jgi:hypothetical protein
VSRQLATDSSNSVSVSYSGHSSPKSLMTWSRTISQVAVSVISVADPDAAKPSSWCGGATVSLCSE